MKTGSELIQTERQRQIDKEGYTKEHDANHADGSLALIAAEIDRLKAAEVTDV